MYKRDKREDEYCVKEIFLIYLLFITFNKKPTEHSNGLLFLLYWYLTNLYHKPFVSFDITNINSVFFSNFVRIGIQ